MPPPLRLELTDYIDATRWRWVLSDYQGRFLADHNVHLDPTSREYGGFLDVSTYLDHHQPIYTPTAQLNELGIWIGAQVFGELRAKLWQKRASPAVAVRVSLPPAAHDLLQRPFELARFADGQGFREAGLRFVYEFAEPTSTREDKQPIEDALRILAVFSLPARSNPLNLRRERYCLQQQVRELNQSQGLAVELRILQYGATRDTLQEALEEGEGWDIIHLSGHGRQGELLLEDARGNEDTIDTNALGDLLAMARERLKLLILDACYSGFGSHAAARAQVGLDSETTRHPETADATRSETTTTALPGLAQSLSQRLDCAALAMRYPVGDAFATELMLALYEKLLNKRRTLPGALQLALNDALKKDIPKPPLSAFTPMLVGDRAAALGLVPPQASSQPIALPVTGLEIGFPPEPERFVGRLQPMLRASQVLAPHSQVRGVLFYGMPGAGKTACALELAYRHEHGRFEGYVWHHAPEEGSEISGALFNLMQDIQTQLNAPQLGLTAALDDPAQFREYTLPRLRALLQEKALLLVLDNLESLLTPSDQWRDPLWGEVIAALLGHNGGSRVVLTARRVPADLANNSRVLREPIHALSLAESVLLARELPHLKRLFDDDAGIALLRATLRVVQGSPKLLELAEGLAADRAALQQRVDAAANELAERADVLDAFFATGVQREGETRQTEVDFVHTLRGWTNGVAAGLAPTAALLLAFLCRVEPEDRQRNIVEKIWKHFLARLGEEHNAAAAALAEPEQGLPVALTALEAAGLVAVDRPTINTARQQQLAELAAQNKLDLAAVLAWYEAQTTTYSIHPGVAETVRGAAIQAVLAATDIELGDYHIAMYQQALKNELQGHGATVTSSARRAAPYLLRQSRWMEAGALLEQMLHRDQRPDTLAFALPLLRYIADATIGTERELIDAGVLARTLQMAGRTIEAEPMLRDLVDRSIQQGTYRIASGIASNLLDLLRASGRLTEALAVAEEKADYTRQAGLGPWTQLSDERQRLQVLAAMGHYDEVLQRVEALRPQMDALPLQSEVEEAANPWNVREGLLDTSRSVAMQSERWESALALNAEVVKFKQERGADALELASTRFNDYGPLLSLNRYDAARALLQACRIVFEAERDILGLGKVYSALADLEDNTGSRATAVRFEEVALDYTYQIGQPEDCASSHHNLANYLERQNAEPSAVLAHRLVAVTIRLQMQSGLLITTIRTLSNSDLPPIPPGFDTIATQVELIPGVRFRALFERLPRTASDGDAAIAAVWQRVAEEKQRREEERQQHAAVRQRQEAVLATLPAAVQAAFALDGDEFSAALRTALAALPVEEQAAIVQQLRDAELIGGGTGPDMEKVLREFAPLLQRIVAAVSDASLRAEIEPELVQLEENGWMLREPVQRIWAGERDAEALTAGIDGNSAQLVREVLRLVAEAAPGD